MSSLMKTTATQENPIYNMDITAAATDSSVETVDEITTSPTDVTVSASVGMLKRLL